MALEIRSSVNTLETNKNVSDYKICAVSPDYYFFCFTYEGFDAQLLSHVQQTVRRRLISMRNQGPESLFRSFFHYVFHSPNIINCICYNKQERRRGCKRANMIMLCTVKKKYVYI